MSSLFKRKKHQEVVEMDKEWIILDLEAYTITSLNEVGRFCWSLLYEEKPLEAIVEIVAEEYQIEPKDVEQDIILFLNKMEKCGLVEHVC